MPGEGPLFWFANGLVFVLFLHVRGWGVKEKESTFVFLLIKMLVPSLGFHQKNSPIESFGFLHDSWLPKAVIRSSWGLEMILHHFHHHILLDKASHGISPGTTQEGTTQGCESQGMCFPGTIFRYWVLHDSKGFFCVVYFCNKIYLPSLYFI